MIQAGESEMRFISATHLGCRDKLTPFGNRKGLSVPLRGEELLSILTQKGLPFLSMDLLGFCLCFSFFLLDNQLSFLLEILHWHVLFSLSLESHVIPSSSCNNPTGRHQHGLKCRLHTRQTVPSAVDFLDVDHLESLALWAEFLGID